MKTLGYMRCTKFASLLGWKSWRLLPYMTTMFLLVRTWAVLKSFQLSPAALQ